MKVIIAGSRSITDITTVIRAIEESGFEITEVISGGARGVDLLGEEWAQSHSIPVRQFLPDYKTHGRRAPLERNKAMATYAAEEPRGALIAVWDGLSSGTWHMINEAHYAGLSIHRDIQDRKETTK